MIWFLYGLCTSMTTAALYYVLAILPPELEQGLVQKIFFFHVPSAFVMYALATVGMLFSVLYLFQKKEVYDHTAKASMFAATLFGVLVIVSGPIWAKPIWGVYWTWDPRLTSTFVLFVLLVAYCITRRLMDRINSSRAANIGAVLAIFAVLDIPLVHLSARLLRGLHPSVLSNPNGLPDSYRNALEIMILSFFLLGALIFWVIFKYIRVYSKLDQIQRRLEHEHL